MHEETCHPVQVEENYTILADAFFNAAPNDWGGAYVDGNTLVVRTVRYPVDEATELLAKFCVTDGIDVVPSDVSIADLKKVTRDIVESRTAGVISVGPQYASSRVVVAVERDDFTQRAALFKIGGDRVLTYLTTTPTTTSSRYWDMSPMHGGAQIVLTGTPTGTGSVCTSGFAWTGDHHGQPAAPRRHALRRRRAPTSHHARAAVRPVFRGCGGRPGAELHHDLSHGQALNGTITYTLLFVPIWWAWMSYSWFATAFDNDDVGFRLLTGAQMLGVLGVAAAIPAAAQATTPHSPSPTP